MYEQHRIPSTLSDPETLARVKVLMAAAGSASRRVCALLGFLDARGRPQLASCMRALRALDAAGHIRLPAPRHNHRRCRPRCSGRPVPPPVGLPARVDQLRGLELVEVTDPARRGIWNELMRSEHPRGAVQQVAQLGAHVVGRAARVLAGDQLVPEAPLVVAGHLDHCQCLHQIDPLGHARRLRDRPSETAGPAAPASVARGGQLDALVGLETAQRLHAASQLGAAESVMESEQLADAPADFGAAGRAGLSQQVLQPSGAVGAGEGGSNLILLVHALGMPQGQCKC